MQDQHKKEFSNWYPVPTSCKDHSVADYKKTHETLSHAGQKATAAFSNVGTAISKKFGDMSVLKKSNKRGPLIFSLGLLKEGTAGSEAASLRPDVLTLLLFFSPVLLRLQVSLHRRSLECKEEEESGNCELLEEEKGRRKSSDVSNYSIRHSISMPAMRNSPTFKSFEERVETTVTSLKTKVGGTNHGGGSFEEVLSSTAQASAQSSAGGPRRAEGEELQC
eukprot:bmy_13458T0